MQIEDPLKGRKKNQTTSYNVSDFAKSMNCSVSLLNNLDSITKQVFSNSGNSDLIGNIGCRYCGRCNENQSIWCGLYFERPANHRLAVGFCVYDPNQDQEKYPASEYIDITKLLAAKYNYIVEYTEIDGGYWFYVYLDCSLDNTANINVPIRELKTIIDSVINGK